MSQLQSTNSWQSLSTLSAEIKKQHMRDWFKADPNRAERYVAEACGISLDYSKNLINDEVLATLQQLAEELDLQQKANAMFSGEKINFTENRAVLHTALRNFSNNPVMVDGKDVMPEVKAALDKMETFVSNLMSGELTGYTDKPFTDVVAIGIGGSFLGPKIMSEALKPYWQDKVKVHFVANVDACHIQDVLASVNKETTLFIMSSKSFGTQETLQNTLTAKAWFLEGDTKETDVAKHFVAVSSNIEAAIEFGMDPNNLFPMWDWVGGRYSMWSAIGLPLAIAIGFDNFKSLLEGAHEMDKHFCSAPLNDNLPVILALLGIWYRNFFNAQSYVLLPYYHYLRGLPAYVQQLDMESNGKQVSGDETVDYETGPIVWGSEGTNGQHSFHQLLHQGNTLIPADFIMPLTVNNQDDTHHAMLASNCFAQSQALMQGQSFEEICHLLEAKGITGEEMVRLAKHKTMPGNKPSNTFTFDKLDPFTLGAMIAMYEHKVFVQGIIWGINSYDQWGVELGKVLGNQILDEISKANQTTVFDASTNKLVQRFKAKNQD